MFRFGVLLGYTTADEAIAGLKETNWRDENV